MKTSKYFLLSLLLTLIVCPSSLAQGPGEPLHPMTAPGARGIRLTGHTLIWGNPTSILYNEIYFSEDSTLVSSLDPSVRILSGYPNTVYISVNLNLIGALNIATKYFWRVVEFDSSNYTEGEIWYFKTKGYYPYLEEDFSNGLGNWSIIGPQGINNWIISNSSNAGGSSPELRFTWNPQFNGNSFIVCDYVYDTEPAFFIEFRHFVDMYSDTVTVGCGYTIDEGSTWIPLWEISPTGNVGPANIFLSLPTENNVQFAFYFSGNSNNINDWYIDDVHIYGPITQSFPPSFLLAKTDTLQSKVNLDWNNGSSPDPITGYRIQRKRGLPNDSTNYVVLAETDGITFAYSDTSIQTNNVYTYRIQTLSGPGPHGSIWGNEATAYVPKVIPVELIIFIASVSVNDVHLNWSTATELNNSGFEILRFAQNDDNAWQKIGFVPGHGTTTEQQHYSFVDEYISSGKYQYRLKQIDYNGTFEYSDIVEVEVGLPTKFSLEQNYPNPFNPSTKIKYCIPFVETGHAPSVQLIVYDILGNEIANLVNEEKSPGEYEVEFNASGLPSGIYFYKLKANSEFKIKKMILIR